MLLISGGGLDEDRYTVQACRVGWTGAAVDHGKGLDQLSSDPHQVVLDTVSLLEDF